MYATKILNKLNKQSELNIPYWLTLFFLAEWIYNPQLNYKTFVSCVLLLIWAIQEESENQIMLWLNYSFRVLLVVSLIFIAHPNECWSALEKLGF
jgi:hypothetical protein